MRTRQRPEPERRPLAERQALTRTVRPRDHAPLATLGEAFRYMAALPPHVESEPAWQHAAQLALRLDDRTGQAAIAAFTEQLERALFLTFRADLAARGTAGKRPPAPSIRMRRRG